MHSRDHARVRFATLLNSTPRIAGETREVVDEAGRKVTLPRKIERIVSLAPNLTEIVYAVGAGDRLVGNTEYCDYPAEAKKVVKVGDTMHPSVERIIALKPQIVLVSTASQLEVFTKQLDQQNIAVYVTNPRSLDEIFRSVTALGEMFGTAVASCARCCGFAQAQRRYCVSAQRSHASQGVLSGRRRTPLHNRARSIFD